MTRIQPYLQTIVASGILLLLLWTVGLSYFYLILILIGMGVACVSSQPPRTPEPGTARDEIGERQSKRDASRIKHDAS